MEGILVFLGQFCKSIDVFNGGLLYIVWRYVLQIGFIWVESDRFGVHCTGVCSCNGNKDNVRKVDLEFRF